MACSRHWITNFDCVDCDPKALTRQAERHHRERQEQAERHHKQMLKSQRTAGGIASQGSRVASSTPVKRESWDSDDTMGCLGLIAIAIALPVLWVLGGGLVGGIMFAVMPTVAAFCVFAVTIVAAMVVDARGNKSGTSSEGKVEPGDVVGTLGLILAVAAFVAVVVLQWKTDGIIPFN